VVTFLTPLAAKNEVDLDKKYLNFTS
jgi:hypothetical protein